MTVQRKAIHKLVWLTAVEMAAEVFNTLARDNAWYAQYKLEHPTLKSLDELQFHFATKVMGPKLIDGARATLTEMLARNISEEMKIEIHDALIKDNELRLGRGKSLDGIRFQEASLEKAALLGSGLKGNGLPN